MEAVMYRKVDVGGIKVFYREAGPKDAPTILLLHGFPIIPNLLPSAILASLIQADQIHCAFRPIKVSEKHRTTQPDWDTAKCQGKKG
jgi:hypothetical protein